MSLPAPDHPIKLTPSMLTFLWDECRRCFWLHARGLHRPQMPFPSVFTRYHEALLRHCLGRCPSLLSSELPKGQFIGGELWVTSAPLSQPGRDGQIYLRGRLDHLAQFEDGTFGVIDFKTTSPSEASVAKYSRQLHAYAWALEQAAPNGLCRTPVTHLGLFCLDPMAVRGAAAHGTVQALLQPHYLPIERDNAGFEAFLGEVYDVLRAPSPPKPGRGCSCCRYWHRRAHLEDQFAAHA